MLLTSDPITYLIHDRVGPYDVVCVRPQARQRRRRVGLNILWTKKSKGSANANS
jgi:hypothetical protein